MSRKAGSDMKEAFQRLKVNQPFALSKAGPALAPPQSQKEVPQTGVPPLEAANQNEAAQKEGTRPEVPQNERAQPKPTQIERPIIKAAQTECAETEVAHTEVGRNKAPQKEGARSKVPRKELSQNEAPQKEADMPQGFFKLSHAVFSDPTLRELSGDCFRLFLWISSKAWRYPTSDGLIRASISYIETGTGMSHATVSRSLKTLKEKALITVREVDFKKGNVWCVTPIACGYPGDDNPPRKKVPQNEGPQIETGAASKGVSDPLKTRQLLPQNEGQIRSFKKVRNLKEVPTENVFVSVPPQEPELSIEERRLALDAFEKSLGDRERETVLKDFVSREYPHGYLPPARVVRFLVASQWYQAQTHPLYAAGAN